MTIVGMVPPVYYKGDLLVDGGYMNNIPVDVMRSMGVDTVSMPCFHWIPAKVSTKSHPCQKLGNTPDVAITRL